jgi:hypothetical protein
MIEMMNYGGKGCFLIAVMAKGCFIPNGRLPCFYAEAEYIRRLYL